jgi:anaerobic selenocysteine-containing dehydrogenase
MKQIVTRTTCPRDCYDACGAIVVRQNGRLTIRGDPDHPVSRGRLCRKCSIAYNGVLQDPSARLAVPLRRVGSKGQGRLEPVSWDEALSVVAEEVGGVIQSRGGQAVVNVHYTGTCSLLAYDFPLRLTRRIGATEVEPDTVCNLAGHAALGYMYGTSLDGFDPRTSNEASCILVWGANPSATAPHQHDHWLPEAPGTVIVVDPVRTPTAKAADLHLQPFPGTDAALAFALLHVIERDGLADTSFLDDHTLGWDELAPLVEPCTSAWAEQQTGVPAAAIEEAARIYGRGPSLLWIGQGLQRQPLGGNIVRAVATLPAVTGNLGRPGSGFLYLNGRPSRCIDSDYLAATELADDPPTISHMDLASHLERPEQAGAMLCWNMNPAASNPEQARLRQALARDDLFTVVIDLFQTDTVDYADIVLPAASFLEFDDLVSSYFHLSLGAQAKAVDPPGQALPNSEIFRRLAAALGYTEPALFEPDRTVIETILDRSGLGVTWEELVERGTVWISDEPRVQFPERVFPTPSGRVELASTTAASDGHGRTPLPLSDPRPADGRLRLLSPASPWLMNTSFANDQKISKRIGKPTIGLHPDDAADRGLSEGQRARVQSHTGELTLLVTITDIVPPGVAYSPKGRWPKIDDSAANVNALVPGRKSDMGESTSLHATEITVTALWCDDLVGRNETPFDAVDESVRTTRPS